MKKYILLIGLVLGVSSILQAYINQPKETDLADDDSIDILCSVPSESPKPSPTTISQNSKSTHPPGTEQSPTNPSHKKAKIYNRQKRTTVIIR